MESNPLGHVDSTSQNPLFLGSKSERSHFLLEGETREVLGIKGQAGAGLAPGAAAHLRSLLCPGTRWACSCPRRAGPVAPSPPCERGRLLGPDLPLAVAPVRTSPDSGPRLGLPLSWGPVCPHCAHCAPFFPS